MARTKIDLILHPVRMRIIGELGGRTLSTRQLAASLSDVPQATLYRHVAALLAGGLLRVVSEQRTAGGNERLVAINIDAMRIHQEDIEGFSADDHIRLFGIFASSLIDTFARYARHADLSKIITDGMSYNQLTLNLTDEERDTLRIAIQTAVRQSSDNPPSPDRKRFTLATIVIPEVNESSLDTPTNEE